MGGRAPGQELETRYLAVVRPLLAVDALSLKGWHSIEPALSSGAHAPPSLSPCGKTRPRFRVLTLTFRAGWSSGVRALESLPRPAWVLQSPRKLAKNTDS